jgi:hypothetical protein
MSADRFNELMSELLSAREANGGPLAQGEESLFAARLAQCWSVMSEKEQREAVRKWTDLDKEDEHDR